MSEIVSVKGRRVWDSRGRPTVEAEVTLVDGATGRAIAPAGASTGEGEAKEKRDGGVAFGGLDVTGALEVIIKEITPELEGRDATDQQSIDSALIDLDGTPNKGRLGANAVTAVSMAVAHAAAASVGLPLWRYLSREWSNPRLPLPEIQIIGGGAHAGRRLDVQDFMVIAVGASTYDQALDWTAEVYRSTGQILDEAGFLQGVADEGGYWPAFSSNAQALTFLVAAIEKSGLVPGEQVAISLDVAANQLRDGEGYRLEADDRSFDSDGLAELLLRWVDEYPIFAIEDPFAEDDAEAMIKFTAALGDRTEIVADDFVCTNAMRIRSAAEMGAGNTALIKPNQVGTLTETKTALDAARSVGWNSIVSARSGESEDVTVVHLAVGWGVKQIKVGSFARSERMAKWNEGLRIAEALGEGGSKLPQAGEFPWGRVKR